MEGEIEGVKVTLTADTGATRSIISSRIYNSIPKEHQPILRKSVGLSGVSGLPLQQYGCAIFQMKLGDLILDHEFTVAEVEDEGLLGMDILFQDRDGPADILLSKNIIRLLGVRIPCVQKGLREKVRKVRIVEKLSIS